MTEMSTRHLQWYASNVASWHLTVMTMRLSPGWIFIFLYTGCSQTLDGSRGCYAACIEMNIGTIVNESYVYDMWLKGCMLVYGYFETSPKLNPLNLITLLRRPLQKAVYGWRQAHKSLDPSRSQYWQATNKLSIKIYHAPLSAHRSNKGSPQDCWSSLADRLAAKAKFRPQAVRKCLNDTATNTADLEITWRWVGLEYEIHISKGGCTWWGSDRRKEWCGTSGICDAKLNQHVMLTLSEWTGINMLST